MRLDTITLEDLRVTIDHLIELHGPKKEVTDFNITLKKGNIITFETLTHNLRKISTSKHYIGRFENS